MADIEKELEAAVIGDFVTVESIEAIEIQYKESIRQCTLTEELKFSYAWHLIKSQYKKDINKGIKIMEELIQQGRDQRDYYYFVGLGHYKLEEYEAAEKCVNRVLHMEPNNYQAKQLKTLINKKIKKDGLIGLGVLGGAALMGGALAAGAVALVGFGLSKVAKK